MNRRTLLAAAMTAGIALAFGARAAPPEGKGQGHGGNPHGKGNNGHKGKGDSGDAYTGLIYAGITSATARRYALDSGVRGYASLPPGIRKNLARGKPLPPGIAKKLVPGPLLGRLPRYDGYEWRVAGADLVLIAIGSAVVADVLHDVFN